MTYEYFTNLDIQHIDVDTINQEFDISEFCRGIEFSKDINQDEIIGLNTLLESISNLELKNIITSLYSGLTELSLSKNNGLTPSFELINFLDFLKKKTLKDSISSNPLLLFSKSIIQTLSLTSEYQIDLAISQLLKDIVTSVYSGLTSLSFAKTNSLKPSFLLDTSFEFTKELTSYDYVTYSTGIVTSLSFSKTTSFTPDITLIHKLLFDKSNSFSFNSIQDYNFEFNVSQSLEDTITSVFAGLTSLSFSTVFGLKPIFSLVLPRDRLADKVVRELLINIKQIPISISVKQIPISISAYSG